MPEFENRHAYLIMCHNNFEHLKKLINLLDDERNDIYVLVDKKSKSFDEHYFSDAVKYAHLEFTKRISVGWGGDTQIYAELLLLEAAASTPHSYYHLLSGNDLPLKSQKEIHDFYLKNDGLEFISIGEKLINCSEGNSALFFERIGTYHLFQNFVGKAVGCKFGARSFERLSQKIQGFFKVDRIKKHGTDLYKGANWFSITQKMAEYVLKNKKAIKKQFGCGYLADEVFLQTIAMQSPFKDKITGECMTYADWERGIPYTFTGEDFDMLMARKEMFARKFDYSASPEIVDMIFKRLKDSVENSN